MLKLFPIVGVILLTILIGYIVYRIVWDSRRRIVVALNPVEALIKAGVLDEDDPNVQAWRDYCDQPGDDKPTPIPFSPTGRYHTGGIISQSTHGLRGNEVPALLPGEHYIPHLSRRSAPRPAVATEPESLSPLSRDSGSLHYPTDDELDPYRAAVMPELRGEVTSALLFDEGEPLLSPPQPNIGGLGKPPYAGPHYDVPHDRFVPYDVLGEPIPGTAVHIVGNVACVGPLPEDEEDPKYHPVQQYREDEQ